MYRFSSFVFPTSENFCMRVNRVCTSVSAHLQKQMISLSYLFQQSHICFLFFQEGSRAALRVSIAPVFSVSSHAKTKTRRGGRSRSNPILVCVAWTETYRPNEALWRQKIMLGAGRQGRFRPWRDQGNQGWPRHRWYPRRGGNESLIFIEGILRGPFVNKFFENFIEQSIFSLSWTKRIYKTKFPKESQNNHVDLVRKFLFYMIW